MVGKLIYLSHTRPDIAYAVSIISQYMHQPSKRHLEAAYHILRYLKRAPRIGLLFKKNQDRRIVGFAILDWVGSIEDSRSVSGYCTKVWGNLVTWRSKKQPIVAQSSAEVEYQAISQGICEVIWLENLMSDLSMPMSSSKVFYSDSQSAINIMNNPIQHDRMKHVRIDRNFVKQEIEEGGIKLMYIPTASQEADILTKAMQK